MNIRSTGWMVALAAILIFLSTLKAPDRYGRVYLPPQYVSAALPEPQVASGQEMKILGIVTKRHADSFILRDQGSSEWTILLTPQTSVKTHKKGVLRGGKEYGVSYILRGLRLEVNGMGNAQGQVVADKIRFDEDDLRTAQALQVRVDPVEKLAEENRQRIGAAEEEARRQARELEANKAATKKAQETADMANNRINGLDDYAPVRTITVPFAVGRSALGPKGKSIIDEAAVWTRTQNTKGWVVAIVGFADTSGNTEANRKLSEQRARNRRVEIRLMVNKGIANVP